MKIHGLFATFLLSISLVFAQQEHPFNNDGSWQYVSSDNFDVYYSKDHLASARQVAKYAEIARYELGVLFDFSPEDRYILIYHSDAFYFQHSNFSRSIYNERISGVFKLPERGAFVQDPGSTKKLYEAVKRQVSMLMLREFAHDNSMGRVMQNHLLLHDPQWFNEGLSEYVATGWTFEDEMWLHGVKHSDILSLALEGNEHINRVIRKSLWHYIVHEYTDQKISEIIYLVNISHSIESGIISVLGITLNTLTQRWREFILSQVSAEATGRTEVNKLPDTRKIPIKPGYQLSSFAYSEASNMFAVSLHKEGAHQLFLYDVASETYIPTSVKTGIKQSDAGHFDYHQPIAWSYDGKQLAMIIYKHPYLDLIYYDIETKTVTTIPLDTDIQKITSLAWSHDGQRLAISALANGQVDLFLTSAGEANLEPVTNDVYDELDPIWSFDDQYIFFSSNRPSAKEEEWERFENHLDLFSYQHTEKKFERLTNTPFINERYPYVVSSYAVNYLSDASGINNINGINIFQKETFPVSNLAQGVFHVSGTESYLAFSTAIGGKEDIYLAKNQNLQAQSVAQPTALRKAYDLRIERILNEKKQISSKNDRKIITENKPVVKQPQEKKEEKPKEQEKAKDKDEPVRYYLFDEGNEPYEVKKPEKALFDELTPNTSLINGVLGGKPRPKESEIDVRSSGRAGIKWATDYLTLNARYDPIARYGIDLGLGFSDLLKNHRVEVQVTPFLNFRNGDVRLKYEYLKHRIDAYAEAGFSTRHYQRDNFRSGGDSLIFRYENANVTVGAKYPISSRVAVGLEGGFQSLQRKDLKLLRDELLDESDQVATASAYLQFNNIKKFEDFPYSGVSAEARVNSYYSLDQQDFAFHTIKLDVDHYFEVYNKIVLATHLRGGFSLGNNRQRFYMGGINDWMVGVFFDNDSRRPLRDNTINPGLYNFQYQEFLNPVHGFGFSTREGSKYVLANFELRLPISRLIRQSLNAGALYHVELIPFFDAGTVWFNGNPFSQKNPTDTQIIGSSPVTVQLQTLKSPFLFGFGTGFRVFMLGYSIRTDIGWGLDDNDLNAPIFSLSVGKNF